MNTEIEYAPESKEPPNASSNSVSNAISGDNYPTLSGSFGKVTEQVSYFLI